MRKRFDLQMKLGEVAIERVVIPTKSRDELPAVLKGLQWIYTTPEVSEKIFQLLEEKVQGTKKQTGRIGMYLWHILVLGIVRLALDCDYDRLEYLVHYDSLLRQIMGLEALSSDEFAKGFHQKTIQENISYIDDDLLEKINAIVVLNGRELFKKKEDEKINVKTDTYVVETNIHFPTDLNLLWDAARKCIQMTSKLCGSYDIEGWRKNRNWLKKLKVQLQQYWQTKRNGGKNKDQRLLKNVTDYLESATFIQRKTQESICKLYQCSLTLHERSRIHQIEYYNKMLIKHIELVKRRLVQGEVIPHDEKIFSLFEPHTQWVNKGKMNPSIELGRKLLIASDQYDLILFYKVMDQLSDSNETIPMTDKLLEIYGQTSINSISFDRGFSCEEARELLELFIPNVIMPKKGRLNSNDKERESTKTFKNLRKKHSTVESNINALEHHGLNRCPDKGLHGLKRYSGFGVLAYNCHKIGIKLAEQERHREFKKAA